MGKGQRRRKGQTLSLAEFTAEKVAGVEACVRFDMKTELILEHTPRAREESVLEELTTTSKTPTPHVAASIRQPATKAQFDQILAETTAAGRALIVAFTAAWCAPCQRIAPAFATLASEVSWAAFIKVDVDENQETAQTHKISSMPTFKAFCDGGVEAGTLQGPSPDALSEFVRQHSGPDPTATFIATLSADQLHMWRQAQAKAQAKLLVKRGKRGCCS